MNKKLRLIIVMVLIAMLVMAVVVRLLFWQALLDLLSGNFLR
jgi:hypothetical protein